MTEESVPVTLVHEKNKIKLIDTPGTGNADNYKELELGRLDSLKDERHLLKQFKDGFNYSFMRCYVYIRIYVHVYWEIYMSITSIKYISKDMH